jgi:hypothetical protein
MFAFGHLTVTLFRFLQIIPLKKFIPMFAEIYEDLHSRAAGGGASSGGVGTAADVTPSVQQIALTVAESQVKDFAAVNITEIDFVLLSIFMLFFLYLCESEVTLNNQGLLSSNTS